MYENQGDGRTSNNISKTVYHYTGSQSKVYPDHGQRSADIIQRDKADKCPEMADGIIFLKYCMIYTLSFYAII